MRILFFYIGTPSPILETELELIRKHEKSGDSVRVIQCAGNLPNCHWNIAHSNSQCAKCRSKFENGWKILKPGKNVELKQFPPSVLHMSDFSHAFDTVEDVKRYQYENQNIGYGVASTLISITRDHRFNVHKFQDEIIRTLNTSIDVYRSLKKEFEEFKPDAVYFFNGRISTHLPAKLLCKKMGIDFFVYEVANKKNSYTLFKNVLVHEPLPAEEVSFLRKNWVKENENAGASLFNLKRNGIDNGRLLSLIKHQVKGVLPKGISKNKKNIAIFGGTIDEYAGVEGWDNIFDSDETKGIKRILEAFESDNQYMFYLRVHPNMKDLPNTTSQLADVRELSLRFSNLCVIWPKDVIDSYALMDVCEKIIVFSSTMGVEATYWGKPSISVGHAFYENFECTYKPKSIEELTGLLYGNIKPLSAESALQYAFWSLTNGIQFEYFKASGYKNSLATGTFDGVKIKANTLPTLYHWLCNLPSRLKRIILNPSLIYLKIQKNLKR